LKKHLTYISLFLTFTLNSFNVFAFEPVIVTCAEVHPDGSVTIFWENPSDLSDFKQYDIYHSSGTNFVKLISINIITDNYTHITNLGNQAQQFYYVEIISQSDENEGSEIISTIFLQLDSSDPGKATLVWNAIDELLPTGSSDFYKIYKRIHEEPENLNWELIADDINNTLYNYIVEDGLCNDSINFKIEMENSSGCISVSNIKGDWFNETNFPDIPVFDSVSIDINSNAILGWQPSTSQDVDKYFLYELDGSTWQIFDEILGINNTSYTDTRYNACRENHSYAISAVDLCENNGQGTFLQPLRPIFLDSIRFNVCKQQDTLYWDQYINAEPEVENYLVWRSDNGSDFNLIQTLPPLSNDTIRMSFIDQNINPGTNYEYFIQAVFGNASSSSCKKNANSFSYKIPQHIYFANADVLQTNEIDLLVDVDTSLFSCTWELHRYDPLSNIDDNFSSTQKSQLQGFPLNILDIDVDPKTTYYEYYALVYDSCGIERLESNKLKTIHLSGSKTDQQTNHLEWNAFEGWETEVEKYDIYRISANETNAILIGSVDNQTYEYDDLISSDQATEGKLSYWVEAKQTIGGDYNYNSYSNSNLIDIFFESNIYFPNAFRPGGLNNEFKPIFNFFSGSNYSFQIFNRWGQLVFETSDPEEGWDGLVDGKSQISGTYVYRLFYKSIYEIDVDQKGTVLLIK